MLLKVLVVLFEAYTAPFGLSAGLAGSKALMSPHAEILDSQTVFKAQLTSNDKVSYSRAKLHPGTKTMAF